MTGFLPGGRHHEGQLLLRRSVPARAHGVNTIVQSQSQRKASALGIGHVNDVVHFSEQLPHVLRGYRYIVLLCERIRVMSVIHTD
eukprot:13794945-Heterocapsa_arctica.AAC.1